jgi:hypothetical protein
MVMNQIQVLCMLSKRFMREHSPKLICGGGSVVLIDESCQAITTPVGTWMDIIPLARIGLLNFSLSGSIVVICLLIRFRSPRSVLLGKLQQCERVESGVVKIR